MWPELIDLVKWRIGAWLLQLTMTFLPEHAWQREALERELLERRTYERYIGYTLLMGAAVIPFERWCSEWRGMTRLRKPLQMPQRQDSNARDAWRETPTVFAGPAGDWERSKRRKAAAQ